LFPRASDTDRFSWPEIGRITLYTIPLDTAGKVLCKECFVVRGSEDALAPVPLGHDVISGAGDMDS
jgi:hypothetical protein